MHVRRKRRIAVARSSLRQHGFVARHPQRAARRRAVDPDRARRD